MALKDGSHVMKKLDLRTTGVAWAAAALLWALGCRTAKSPGPGKPPQTSELQPLVTAKSMAGLHWPDFSDIQPEVQKFYEDRSYALAWTKDGKLTKQASGFLEALQNASLKGLNPDDYDAALLAQRGQQLSAGNAQALAQFDSSLTIDVMRFVSDLHMGRINPQHFNFDIKSEEKKLDLASFLSSKALDTGDVPQLVTSLEPDSEPYRQTEQALAHYLDLAKQQGTAEPLPTVTTPVTVGHTYPAAAQLWQRLQLESDAPSGDAPANYNDALAAAVKNFQHRHGLTEDGKLTPQTLASLNVPLSDRVAQLQNSLERWRTLPDPYLNPRLLVNLPEFLLRGYGDDHHLAFTMKVVDGKVKGDHETPVFTQTMKYLIFRPYWNVPVDIAKKELVPHMEARPGYLEAKNYEVITNKGVVKPEYTTNEVVHGMVMVREKPGPTNSLGLVKFMFPNEYDIYLHSTPEVQLFNRTRRDFSHGCVRVQKPDELAAWVLNGQDDWDLEKVQEAMNTGQDNHQVNLKNRLPVVIFYLTAMPAEDGQIHFFDDIYGYDAQLRDLLAKGMPYPKDPVKVNPKTKPGDTV